MKQTSKAEAPTFIRTVMCSIFCPSEVANVGATGVRRHLHSPTQPQRWPAANSHLPPAQSSGPLLPTAPQAGHRGWNCSRLRPPGLDLYSAIRLSPQSRLRPQSRRLLSLISHPVVVKEAPLTTAGVVDAEEEALYHGIEEDARSLTRSARYVWRGACRHPQLDFRAGSALVLSPIRSHRTCCQCVRPAQLSIVSPPHPPSPS